VITGFNTDVKYKGVIYHVQTEDKGESNPLIETLVYSRGAILDSRRTSYAVSGKGGGGGGGGGGEKAIIRLMEQQHRRMVREVRNGKYDPEGPKPFGYNIISNRTLNEVVLEWLAADRGGEGIGIELSGEETFYDASDVSVEVTVRSVDETRPIEGAFVWVRLFDPRTTPAKLFQGTTGTGGIVEASFRVPDLGGMEGALVFQVKNGDKAAELTRPVLPSR